MSQAFYNEFNAKQLEDIKWLYDSHLEQSEKQLFLSMDSLYPTWPSATFYAKTVSEDLSALIFWTYHYVMKKHCV